MLSGFYRPNVEVTAMCTLSFICAVYMGEKSVKKLTKVVGETRPRRLKRGLPRLARLASAAKSAILQKVPEASVPMEQGYHAFILQRHPFVLNLNLRMRKPFN